MTKATDHVRQELTELIEVSKHFHVVIFPYSTRDIAKTYGISNSTASRIMHANDNLVLRDGIWYIKVKA
jgi:hypothetical protein